MSPLADYDWLFRTPCHERSHRAQYDEAGWCFGATWIFDAARKLQSVFVSFFIAMVVTMPGPLPWNGFDDQRQA